MNQDQSRKTADWMRLSEASDYLGVHFSTLRRWTDDGKIPCYKTPGGRRRYRKSDLESYLRHSRKREEIRFLAAAGDQAQPDIIREIRQLPMREESWYGQISEENQRLMAQSGRRLIGTLMQYVSRTDGGEKYLQQGRKLARRYGKLCLNSGLTVNQTMRAFVSIRHSIVDSLCESGMVVQDSGEETWNIYRRVNYFLDTVMLAILDMFPADPPLAPNSLP
jgi:excisionase family DNA binding protein